MDHSINIVAAISVIFLFAGIVKGVIGMGLPTVAMGVPGAFMPPLSAASLLLIPSFVTMSGSWFRNKRLAHSID